MRQGNDRTGNRRGLVSQPGGSSRLLDEEARQPGVIILPTARNLDLAWHSKGWELCWGYAGAAAAILSAEAAEGRPCPSCLRAWGWRCSCACGLGDGGLGRSVRAASDVSLRVACSCWRMMATEAWRLRFTAASIAGSPLVVLSALTALSNTSSCKGYRMAQ